jgi:hypothetical protein
MFTKAMEELDRLSKSSNPTDELDQLTKALQEELGKGFDVVLRKSVQPAQGTEEAEALRKAQETKDAEEAETLRKAQEAKDAETLRKSQERQSEDDLLVEASEAYANLQKSVETGTNAMLGEMDVLKKAVGSLLNLNIKLAGVIGDITKSKDENLERIAKSVSTIAAAPVAPNAARLGTGSAVEGEEGDLKKSTSEIMESLQKAVQEGKAHAQYLTDFGTYKNVERLPAEVRKLIDA